MTSGACVEIPSGSSRKVASTKVTKVITATVLPFKSSIKMGLNDAEVKKQVL